LCNLLHYASFFTGHVSTDFPLNSQRQVGSAVPPSSGAGAAVVLEHLEAAVDESDCRQLLVAGHVTVRRVTDGGRYFVCRTGLSGGQRGRRIR
jgi:hypothetical protein